MATCLYTLHADQCCVATCHTSRRWDQYQVGPEPCRHHMGPAPCPHHLPAPPHKPLPPPLACPAPCLHHLPAPPRASTTCLPHPISYHLPAPPNLPAPPHTPRVTTISVSTYFQRIIPSPAQICLTSSSMSRQTEVTCQHGGGRDGGGRDGVQPVSMEGAVMECNLSGGGRDGV